MLLSQPGRVGPLQIRNRVIMAPMGTNYSTTDGLSTERDKLYYAERARGGGDGTHLERWQPETFETMRAAHHWFGSRQPHHHRFVRGRSPLL